jgi:hypothetical protein
MGIQKEMGEMAKVAVQDIILCVDDIKTIASSKLSPTIRGMSASHATICLRFGYIALDC